MEAGDLCALLGLRIRWCLPEPNEKVAGRGSVFVRDLDMVHEADLVLAFVDEEADAYSGTAHLLDKAIEADRPVYGYHVDQEGRATRWGENDPDEHWVDMVPAPD